MSSEKSKKTKKTKSSKKETTHHSTLVPSEHIRDRVKELDRERKVYILYTGGTIGMVHKEGVGLVPEPGYLPELISKMKIDKHFKINYTLEATDPLIDSSNLRPNNWKVMVDKIKKNYDRYDSFIIIHGTDTLAYTASALSFFIQNLEKPIIVTGSQLPLTDFRNDASDNIVNSFNLSLFNIPEVLVCFGNRVFRGNRTRKVSSESFIAYDTPNYPILGNIGVNLKIHENLLLPQKTCRLDTLNEWRDDVMILQLRLMPIDNGVILNKLLELKPRAIMLNSYGIGNAPVSDNVFTVP
jgi:L-asparaginase